MDSKACKVSEDLSLQIFTVMDFYDVANGKLTPS